MTQSILAGLLMLAIATPPFSFGAFAHAEVESSPPGEDSSSPEQPTTENTASSSENALTDSAPATSTPEHSEGSLVPSENIAASSTDSVASEVPIFSNTKFTKNPQLSQKAQLAQVREHLTTHNLPQIALERLNAFEARQATGPESGGLISSIRDYLVGDTKEARERKQAERLIKQKPFNVETFEGKIRTAPADHYKQDFSEAKERGILIQKVKNLIENGTLFNSDFNNTRTDGNVISRIFGSKKAIAQTGDTPDEYLAEGNEITFSQAIRDQADALGHDPLKLLNFVRNEIAYVPYYGSKKGADATLVERAGNDLDQASLLIALLRYSGIPARYRHVDAKMSINTVTGLLGVDTAIGAAKVLSLNKIPYVLYTLDGDPYFFVVEHVYVEAYIPYGYSRGADIADGGVSQWVPMDPSVNTYYHDQSIDLIGHLNTNGFAIEAFFGNYLQGNYNALEPLEAFRSEVETVLTAHVPIYFEGLTYEDALVRSYPRSQNLEFIPGSLPYETSADLDTYDYVPSSLRHTVGFAVTDASTEVLAHSAYMSDLADRELLVTYDAATPEDQAIIDSFETIYDVVPLSMVAVKPVVQVNGEVVATASATTTLGRVQGYLMTFESPRRVMGSPVTREMDTMIEKDIIAGNTDAIALDTDRVLPPELRPALDTSSDSFLADQVLYRTALDYLDRLQYAHGELADVTGGDFTHVATRATIFNGINVTYDAGEPYSFDWTGLRIDASSKVRYYHRFSDDIKKNRKEFIAVFGLQASQDESDIFEDNFDVESVATTKGLKLVSGGAFPGITLRKITAANESDIDSLAVSDATKSVFHAAIADGKIIYTPSALVTHGEWSGLFYIVIDFDGGDATYAIGEGLNGGYTVEQWPDGWSNFWRYSRFLTPGLTAIITSPSNHSSYIRGKDDIHWVAEYSSWTVDWIDDGYIKTKDFPLGTIPLRSGYGTRESVNVEITEGTTASTVSCTGSLLGGEVVLPTTSGTIAEEMHLPLWIDTSSGIYTSPRYGGHTQYNRQDDIYSHSTASQFFTDLGDQSTNINDPWIDPKTGKYWNMSITLGAFSRAALSTDHEKYYMNMRWDYYAQTGLNHGQKYFAKKVWIKNPANHTAVLTGIGDFGPAPSTGRVAGASPEAMKAINAHLNSNLEYCLAADQDLPYGLTVTY